MQTEFNLYKIDMKSKGHTNGNSIVIIENDGLFYMIHGDITYVEGYGSGQPCAYGAG